MFTHNQKKAHDVSRHVSITANAGSGKTRVLVGRYCDLVEGVLPCGAIQPDQIAAITFTEKAASELRDRIAAELDSRLTNQEHRANWRDLKKGREGLNSALISTIHGFCSALLRAYPIETGVQPNFRIVSGFERHRMEEEALMEAIEASMIESRDDDEGAYAVARRIGREKFERILRLMLYKRELMRFSRENGVLARDDDAILAMWEASLVAALRGMVVNAETQPAFDMLIDGLKEDYRPTAMSIMSDLSRARSATAIMTSLGNLRRLLFTGTFTILKKNYPRECHDELEPWVVIAGGAFKEASKFIEASVETELHERLLKDARIALGVYERAVREYQMTKDRSSALDFDDLQLRLLEAMADPQNRRTILGDIRFLMIDEFQDTNELQYELVRRLTDGLRDRALCLVGDTKQSIYGFRNADVEVFARATREIEESNRNANRGEGPLRYRDETIEPETRQEALGAIRLDASFRLLPSICAYVNTVCEPILRRRPPFNVGVDYEDLVCARPSKGQGRVEVLVTRVEEDSGDAAEREAENIARRIAAIVAGEETIWEMDKGAGVERPRSARFSDIALLCRKRSIFPAIEKAFLHHRIPYATYGGIGFFRTQEIYDILCYLRFLVNARDDVAALGVFRSPFFAVSDAELYRLSLQGSVPEGSGLWDVACDRVARGLAEPALERGVRLVRDDRAIAGRISAPMLIRRIVERTGWRGAVIGIERGEQALANIEKLIEMGRDFEERGFTSLFDFVEQISSMVDAEEMEGEAPVTTGRDAVALMTMHAAKGLEYPVIILPSLHSPTPSPSSPIFDRELGFGWSWTFDSDEYNPAIVPLIIRRQAAREQAEEARLFYVALTRARDHLVLSGSVQAGKSLPAGSMLAWGLAPLCDVADLDPEGTSIDLPPTPLRFLEEDGMTERTEQWRQSIDVGRRVGSIELEEKERKKIAFRRERVGIGEIPSTGMGEIYSATQYLLYTLCPTRYYLRYRLGLPEDLVDVYEPTDGVDGKGEEGSLFARLFRRLARSIDTLSANPERLASTVEETVALEPLPPEGVEGLRSRLTGTVTRLLASPEAQRVLFPEGGSTRVDHELRGTIDGDFLQGVIDRVLFASDGSVSFVQYRTRRIERDGLRVAAESALPQLRLYAYLLSSLDQARVGITGTIFFTEHPDQPQSFTFTRFDAMRIEQDLRASITDIRALTHGARRALPDRTPHCPDCPFFIGGECVTATERLT